MLLYLLEKHTSENINDGICNVMYCLETSILMLFLRNLDNFIWESKLRMAVVVYKISVANSIEEIDN